MCIIIYVNVHKENGQFVEHCTIDWWSEMTSNFLIFLAIGFSGPSLD